MAGIYSQGGSAGHRYAGWLETVEAKNFQFGGKVFNGSPSAIFVGSKMVWANWLTKATKQAILGAFGQRDGWAVIKATNAYLTQLAVSDRDKATALAGFINEDPMMVCSLGLQPQGVTMPIRYMNSDGNAYILTAIPLNSIDKFTIRGGLRVEETTIIGSCPESGVGSCVMQWSDSILYTYDQRGYNTNGSYSRTDDCILEWGKNIIAVDGVSKGTVRNYSADSNPLSIFWGGKRYGKCSNPIISVQADSSYNFIPCKHKTLGNGMLDLVNVVFYPNAGTGSFTIPDISYTPSTP